MFPRATPLPWDGVAAVVRKFDQPTRTLNLYQSEDNGRAALHAVSTYDARDEALLNALEVLGRFANGSGDNDAGRAYEKIEAALAVKPPPPSPDKIPDPCRSCNGSGEIETEDEWTKRYRRITCPMCQGTGGR